MKDCDIDKIIEESISIISSKEDFVGNDLSNIVGNDNILKYKKYLKNIEK